MSLTLTFAWWMAPVALALVVLVVGIWLGLRAEDGGGFNPVPGLIGCAAILTVIALLLGALFTWLAGR